MSERDWVPAHRRLFKGAKKGWPRAVRFILLELCHEARPTNGVLDFPVEWDTLTAVHDRLGGDRRELRKALTLFQIRDDSGQPVIEIERDVLRHRLKIIKWETWAGPRSGSERMQTLRERELKNVTASHAPRSVTPTGSDSTEQERRGSGARAEGEPPEPERPSTVRLKSVPPLPPDIEPSEPAAPVRPHPPTFGSEDATPGNLGRAGAVASGGSERPVELADRVWRELWQAKYRRPYEGTGKLFGPASEDAVLVRIAEKASVRVGHEEAYLRHKIQAYLRDPGDRNYLAEHCHPLRTLERDWVKYGEPKEPGRLVPRREEPPVELVSVEEMAARAFAVKTMAKVGSGGA